MRCQAESVGKGVRSRAEGDGGCPMTSLPPLPGQVTSPAAVFLFSFFQEQMFQA